MMARFLFLLRPVAWVLLLGMAWGTRAQDGFNLPTELYILLNEGVLERYGLGAEGVQSVTPEGAFVLDFAVSGDNRWLAIRTLENLTAFRFDAPENPLLINPTATYPEIRGKGDTLAWSPQGNVLAYTAQDNGFVSFIAPDGTSITQALNVAGLQEMRWSSNGNYLAAGAIENVWWIFAVANNSARLTSAISDGTSLIWLADDILAFTPRNGGMIAMDLANFNDQIPILDTDFTYHLPFAFSQTSFQLFRGSPESATLFQVTYEGEAFVAREIGDAPIDIGSARWTPNGELLVAFQGGVLAFVNPLIGEGFTLPIASASAYGWGAPYPQRVESTAITDTLYFRAPSAGIVQVWQLPNDGTLAQTITPSEGDVTVYHVARNGAGVAYISNNTLFYYALNADDIVYTLAEDVPDTGFSMAFSADAQTLYFTRGQGLERADLTTGQLFVLAEDTRYSAPQPATSVSALLVNTPESTVFIDTNTGEAIGEVPFLRGWWLNGAQVVFANGASIVRVNANIPEELPTVLAELPPNSQLMDVVQSSADMLRLLFETDVLGQLVIAEVPFGGGELREIARTNALYAPLLTSDGNAVIGVTRSNGGDVVVFSLDSTSPQNRAVRLNLGLLARDLSLR